MIEGSLAQQQQDTFLPSSAVAYFSIYDSWNIPFVEVTGGQSERSACRRSRVLTATGQQPTHQRHRGRLATSLHSAAHQCLHEQQQQTDPALRRRLLASDCGATWNTSRTRSCMLGEHVQGRRLHAGGGRSAASPALDSVKPQEKAPRLRDAVKVNTANGDFTITGSAGPGNRRRGHSRTRYHSREPTLPPTTTRKSYRRPGTSGAIIGLAGGTTSGGATTAAMPTPSRASAAAGGHNYQISAVDQQRRSDRARRKARRRCAGGDRGAVHAWRLERRTGFPQAADDDVLQPTG